MRNAATFVRLVFTRARARTANVNDGDGGVDAMDARRAIGTRREDPTDGLGDDGARRR
jgi:hypothetical protein